MLIFIRYKSFRLTFNQRIWTIQKCSFGTWFGVFVWTWKTSVNVTTKIPCWVRLKRRGDRDSRFWRVIVTKARSKARSRGEDMAEVVSLILWVLPKTKTILRPLGTFRGHHRPSLKFRRLGLLYYLFPLLTPDPSVENIVITLHSGIVLSTRNIFHTHYCLIQTLTGFIFVNYLDPPRIRSLVLG